MLCRTTHENAAKYTQVHDARVALNSKGLTSREQFGGGVSTTRVVRDGVDMSIDDALKGA